MRIKAALDLAQLTTWQQLQRYVSDVIRQIVDLCNGKLSFSENFDCFTASVEFTSTSVDTAVPHGLGRAPNGYIIVKRSANMVIFDGSTENTDSVLYLRTSATGTASVIII